ncbi:MAG TPA: DNA primase [Pyrinomonadaceae bacterium]|nr:DNA primase [Pyrinomonadaceae bacterium]
MRYDESFIEELKNRADLVRIIEPYAPLKKKGQNWMACCPFHQEKTPSFSVNPNKGFYKCFGCGKGGNAYTFLMEMEGLSFPEAIERVAEVAGVPLPEPVDDREFQENKKRRQKRKELSEHVVELNRWALDFWRAELKADNQHAREAREYLEKRGLDNATIDKFEIGFAPDRWDALLSLLREKAADDKLIEQSGLVSKSEEKERIYDRFRGRLIFPVFNAAGDPVAFGARTLGAGEPKYLNSPETPAYVKGDHLYGLFQTKDEIRRKKYAILVEGYLDFLALYQAGVTNAAASLGTAFTEHQARLLGKFARKVVVNYDGDKAGVKAARRAIEILLAEDFEIKVLILPDGSDPDDFIRAHGFKAYKQQHETRATTYLQFVLENSVEARNLSVPKQKAEAIEDVLPVISVIRNPIQKRESFDQAMTFFRVDDVLKRDLWKTVKLGGHLAPDAVRKKVARVSAAKITVAEERLLELLIFDEELRSVIIPSLEETDYASLATTEIFRALLELQKRGDAVTLESLLAQVESEDLINDVIPMLMLSEPPREPGDAIDEVLKEAESCVFTLRSMAISNKILEISRALVVAEQSGDLDSVAELVGEQIRYARIKRDFMARISQG